MFDSTVQLPDQSAPSDGPLPLPRTGLMQRDWLKIVLVQLSILLALALVWVFGQVLAPLTRTLLLFALSAVLAFMLAGPAQALAARTGNRLLAIAVVYLLLGVVVVGGLMLLAGPFVAQATALITNLPQYADSLQARAPEAQSALNNYGIQANLDDLKAKAASAVETSGATVLQHLVGILAEVGGVLVDAILALVISLYLLIDGPSLRHRSLALVPPQHRSKALFIEENAHRVLGGYLRGQLVMAVTIGAIAGIGCWLLGLPYAVVLGVMAGLFELVPMFGPILSAVPAIIVAVFLPFPTVLWVLLFFFAVQQVESNILGPRITGHAVGLHPLGAMFALLAGFQLAGVLGGLFAVPVAGVLWVLLAAAYRNTVLPQDGVKARRFSAWPRGRALVRDQPRPEQPTSGSV
jgi:predicted PurR-regulated permease PerM